MEFGQFKILDKSLKIEDLSFTNDADIVFINFNIDNSIKIIPYFEKIKKKELKALTNVFSNFNISLRTDDFLGKLHFVMLKFLNEEQKKQVLIVNHVGLTNESIDFLQLNFNRLINQYKNKLIIVYSGNG
jgi:hypothetical protein